MACFVGLMRGEILPDRCSQCPLPVDTSMSTDSEIDLDLLCRAPSISRRGRGGVGGAEHPVRTAYQRSL
jgi:hypothetical protein